MSGRNILCSAAALSAALIAAGMVSGPARAAPPAPPAAVTSPVAEAPAALHETIDRQIAAIARKDYDEAFSYASPQIQRRFVTPENFGEMVRLGYPMVQGAQRHVFGAIQPIGPRLRQTVVITDQTGRAWIADYDMIEIDGAWRIDGVQLRRAVQMGA